MSTPGASHTNSDFATAVMQHRQVSCTTRPVPNTPPRATRTTVSASQMIPDKEVGVPLGIDRWALRWGAHSRRTQTRENQDAWCVSECVGRIKLTSVITAANRSSSPSQLSAKTKSRQAKGAGADSGEKYLQAAGLCGNSPSPQTAAVTNPPSADAQRYLSRPRDNAEDTTPPAPESGPACDQAIRSKGQQDYCGVLEIGPVESGQLRQETVGAKGDPGGAGQLNLDSLPGASSSDGTGTHRICDCSREPLLQSSDSATGTAGPLDDSKEVEDRTVCHSMNENSRSRCIGTERINNACACGKGHHDVGFRNCFDKKGENGSPNLVVRCSRWQPLDHHLIAATGDSQVEKNKRTQDTLKLGCAECDRTARLTGGRIWGCWDDIQRQRLAHSAERVQMKEDIDSDASRVPMGSGARDSEPSVLPAVAAANPPSSNGGSTSEDKPAPPPSGNSAKVLSNVWWNVGRAHEDPPIAACASELNESVVASTLGSDGTPASKLQSNDRQTKTDRGNFFATHYRQWTKPAQLKIPPPSPAVRRDVVVTNLEGHPIRVLSLPAFSDVPVPPCHLEDFFNNKKRQLSHNGLPPAEVESSGSSNTQTNLGATRQSLYHSPVSTVELPDHLLGEYPHDTQGGSGGDACEISRHAPWVFAVFDGHGSGGRTASHIAAKNFGELLQKHLSAPDLTNDFERKEPPTGSASTPSKTHAMSENKFERRRLSAIRDAIQYAFSDTQHLILQSNLLVNRDFGTTAVILACVGRHLITATCGDSSAILVLVSRPQQLAVKPQSNNKSSVLSDNKSSSPVMGNGEANGGGLETPTGATCQGEANGGPGGCAATDCMSDQGFTAGTISSDHDSGKVSLKLDVDQRTMTVVPSLNVRLSMDHTLQSLPEIRRIQKEGVGRIVIGDGHVHRLIPSHLTYDQAKTRGLSINMARALGHSILSNCALSPNPQFTLVDILDLYQTLSDIRKQALLLPAPTSEMEACANTVSTPIYSNNIPNRPISANAGSRPPTATSKPAVSISYQPSYFEARVFEETLEEKFPIVRSPASTKDGGSTREVRTEKNDVCGNSAAGIGGRSNSRTPSRSQAKSTEGVRNISDGSTVDTEEQLSTRTMSSREGLPVTSDRKGYPVPAGDGLKDNEGKAIRMEVSQVQTGCGGGMLIPKDGSLNELQLGGSAKKSGTGGMGLFDSELSTRASTYVPRSGATTPDKTTFTPSTTTTTTATAAPSHDSERAGRTLATTTTGQSLDEETTSSPNQASKKCVPSPLREDHRPSFDFSRMTTTTTTQYQEPERGTQLGSARSTPDKMSDVGEETELSDLNSTHCSGGGGTDDSNLQTAEGHDLQSGALCQTQSNSFSGTSAAIGESLSAGFAQASAARLLKELNPNESSSKKGDTARVDCPGGMLVESASTATSSAVVKVAASNATATDPSTRLAEARGNESLSEWKTPTTKMTSTSNERERLKRSSSGDGKSPPSTDDDELGMMAEQKKTRTNSSTTGVGSKDLSSMEEGEASKLKENGSACEDGNGAMVFDTVPPPQPQETSPVPGLDGADMFIVIMSDGITDVMSRQQIEVFVRDQLLTEPPEIVSAMLTERACELRRTRGFRADNCTAVVLCLAPVRGDGV